MKQNTIQRIFQQSSASRVAWVSIRWVVLLLVLLASVPDPSLAFAMPDSTVPCHTIRTSADLVSKKYGSPVNFFGTTQEALLIEVFCSIDGSSRRVKVGDGAQTTYVYKYGYHKVGGVRTRIAFSGATPVGSWFVGSAEAKLPESPETQGSVYAYMCQLVQGAWKCGCSDRTCVTPKWQMQGYAAPIARIEDQNPTQDSFSDEIKEMHKNISETELAKLEKEVEESRVQYSKEVFDVYSALASHVHPGESFALTGYDLAPKDGGSVKVIWGTAAKVDATVTADGRSARVVTPTLPPGKYALRVEREGKITPSQVVVWVKDDLLPVPTITHITPTAGKQGDTFTIFGKGFASEHNDIVTTFGTIEDVASRDGTTMTFVYKPFQDIGKTGSADGATKDMIFTTYVRVINAGGFDPQGVAQFQITL